MTGLEYSGDDPGCGKSQESEVYKYFLMSNMEPGLHLCIHAGSLWGSIQEDLKFIKSLNVDNKKLDESQLWTKLCMHSKAHHVDHEKRIDEKKRFSSHPKRLFSDTDTSVGANSPGRVALSSSDSNLHLDHKETFVYEFYQENKMEMKNTRKKLHKKLTQTKEDNAYHFEVGIGDSSSVSPRSNRDKRSVVFEDEKCQKTEPIKPSRAKPKHKSVVTVPSKKLLPSKASSSHHAQKPLVTDSVFERKFKTFVEKSLHTINDIRALLEIGIGPPDGDEDMSRRITRVKEFSNRFSRNCLYPLARQLNDLSGMSPEDVNVNQRLLSSYQTILNGLQAYLTHLPTSFGSCATDKLKTLLKHLLELCGIHTKLFRLPDENGCLDFINGGFYHFQTFKLNAELTLKKIEEHYNAISTHSMLKSANTTKVSLQRGGASKATLKNNAPNKNKIERRLSMYSMSACFRRDANWKKAVESLAKQKLNVKSRYKTSTFRHRPPLVKEPPILPIPSKFKLFCKKSSDMLRRTPVTTPVNEDTITTMVEMESEKDKLGRKEEDAKTHLHFAVNLSTGEIGWGWVSSWCEVRSRICARKGWLLLLFVGDMK
ncbi:hypothetical protein NQ318_022303 [Aromia moschata]|uniref:Uncharacterized protein n=1 Tax=Aromia moschata TaxID=1265417 RepID=A0AAV8Z6E6_9CUCU|nr:hypothetical protein NQ318_022303 [Aromia moschata]